MQLDLASFASIDAFAQAFLARGLPLHVLICNAGVFCPPFSRTREGFEVSVGVKHVGHFRLIQKLQGALAAGAPSRVVLVSGSAEKGAAVDWGDLGSRNAADSGMGQAARANLYSLMAAMEWNRRLAGASDVFVAHPGLVKTEAMSKVDTSTLVGRVAPLATALLGQAPERGAEPIVHAATAPELQGRGGTYWGPHYVWNCGNLQQRQPQHPLALDAAAQRRVFDETERLIAATPPAAA